MNNVKRLAVYCGSAPGSQPVFADATRATAAAMVGRGVDLVYGGGRLGLMGMIADSVLDLRRPGLRRDPAGAGRTSRSRTPA